MRAFLLALVLVVGVAATTWAAIPDGDGAISGCYAKKGGKLRVVNEGKKCKKSERALTWSQTGPAGAVGAKGPAGPKGAKGDPGTPSVAYATQGFEVLDTNGVVLGELSLPAGKYMLFGTGSASNIGTDPGEVSCIADSSAGDIFGEVIQTVPAGESAMVTATVPIELTAAATVEIFCGDSMGDDNVDLALALTAVRVGSIVRQ